MSQFRDAFPNHAGYSRAVVIFERKGGPLTKADRRIMSEVARRIDQPPSSSPELLDGVRIASPDDLPLPSTGGGFLPRNPLISQPSPDGQAGIIRVLIPASFISTRSANVVEHIRDTLKAMREHAPAIVTKPASTSAASEPTSAAANGQAGAAVPWPAGLDVAVTGSSGVGYDYAQAAKASERQTLFATVMAVAIILLLVYRSPLAAAVPLVCISMAAIVATRLLSLGQYAGLHVGLAENIFVVVLIYGAGVDYSLLLISRFREFAEQGLDPAQASGRALAASMPAIAAAAAINVLGLMMLVFARYAVFRTTGPAVAVALSVALLASLTLLPACVCVLGRRLFWPASIRVSPRPSPLWVRLADAVMRRPLVFLVATLVVLAVPAAMGARQQWVYDTLEAIRSSSVAGVGNSSAGVDIASRHWPIGELAPVEILVKSSRPLNENQWGQVIDAVSARLMTMPTRDHLLVRKEPNVPPKAVLDVRNLTHPLGQAPGQQLPNFDAPDSVLGNVVSVGSVLLSGSDKMHAIGASVHEYVRETYLSRDRRATYMEAVLSTQPLKLNSLAAVAEIQKEAQAAAAEQLAKLPNAPAVDVYMAGPTAEMDATREVTQRDFYTVAALVLGVIAIMILMLLRDALLAAWMLGSTILSYFATLGLCSLVFVTFGQYNGLDWKLEIFLFVVMVAVGQDYNVFLATRLVQERATGVDARQAARRATIATGPVISSCGLIMAATLGSLMVGELALLVQLGFALALGMLIDTFVIRPLLLPAFCALTGHTGKPNRWLH